MSGVIVTDEIADQLNGSYTELLPLLEYLRARIKYDTVRWIRAYGTKDDLVFSTRIKTFDRVYDKLVRIRSRAVKAIQFVEYCAFAPRYFG